MIIHMSDQDTLFQFLFSVAIFESRRELLYKHIGHFNLRGNHKGVVNHV